MKTPLTLLTSLLGLCLLASCANDPNKDPLKINTPAVRAQVLGDVEKVLLAGGGALLITGGNSGAAVAAMTKQEIDNLPGLQKVLAEQQAAPVTSAKNPPEGVKTAP